MARPCSNILLKDHDLLINYEEKLEYPNKNHCEPMQAAGQVYKSCTALKTFSPNSFWEKLQHYALDSTYLHPLAN